MDKLQQLKEAVTLLEGHDIEGLKHALSLIGEPVPEGATVAPRNTYAGGSEIKICVLQRGWVLIGKFTQDNQRCMLTNAAVIRYWGTTDGLGQLAKDGPTSDTKLDKCQDVVFHELTAVLVMDVQDAIWTSKLQ